MPHPPQRGKRPPLVFWECRTLAGSRPEGAGEGARQDVKPYPRPWGSLYSHSAPTPANLWLCRPRPHPTPCIPIVELVIIQ